jgi:hypothetical protein
VFAACSNDDDESGSSALPELTDPEDVCSGMDDLAFMKYCYEHFDVNGDAKVSKAEAAAVTSIEIDNDKVTSLKGIGYFTKLQELDIESRGLTTLDLSKNTNLQKLSISYVGLTTLDLSKNTNLQKLGISYVGLTTLDLSKNTNLQRLYIVSDGLTTLDLSKNTNLQELYISCDDLTSLDLSKNTNLQELGIRCDGLTSLDVESNLKLAYVRIGECKSMTLLKLPSSITEISSIYNYYNALTTLYCGATTPPNVYYSGYNFLKNCKSLSKIYVPESAVSAYKSADGWKEYADLIYGY